MIELLWCGQYTGCSETFTCWIKSRTRTRMCPLNLSKIRPTQCERKIKKRCHQRKGRWGLMSSPLRPYKNELSRRGAKMAAWVEQWKSPPQTIYIFENTANITLPKRDSRRHRTKPRLHPYPWVPSTSRRGRGRPQSSKKRHSPRHHMHQLCKLSLSPRKGRRIWHRPKPQSLPWEGDIPNQSSWKRIQNRGHNHADRAAEKYARAKGWHPEGDYRSETISGRIYKENG